jgi:hypothetical protein
MVIRPEEILKIKTLIESKFHDNQLLGDQRNNSICGDYIRYIGTAGSVCKQATGIFEAIVIYTPEILDNIEKG